MRYYLEIARTGLTALLLYPQRSLVTLACLIAVLLPYLVGLGLSQGVQEEADTAVRFGADLYVTGQQFGRPIPLPLATVAEVQKIPGVTAVVPRIVGRIELGTENVSAVLVGVPVKDFPADLDCIQGRLYQGSKRNELVIGTELAQQLNLQVGSFIPYFYSNRNGERVSEVVGIFRSDVSLWQARLILTSFETAAHIFDQPALATDLLVYCRPGYQEPVQRAILHNVVVPVPGGQVGTRVVAREELTALLPQGLLHREGIFTLLFVLAFAVGILVIMVTSGFGLSGRRREIGILKATGWQTDELLLRSLVESFLLSLAGLSGASSGLCLAEGIEWLLDRWGLPQRSGTGARIPGAFSPDTDTYPSGFSDRLCRGHEWRPLFHLAGGDCAAA